MTLLVFEACNKDATPESGPKSTWSIDGITYTERTTPAYWDDGSGASIASDNSMNGDIKITFGPKPTMDGSFPLAHASSDTSVVSPGTNCIIDVSTGAEHYISTGETNADVSVTVATDGKLTATFFDIQMANTAPPYTTKNLSGTIIEK